MLGARGAGGVTAEALRQSQEVRAPRLHADSRNVPLVHPLHDRLQGIVVPNDDRKREAFLCRRCQLADREHDSAVARDGDHRPMRRADLGTNGHRQRRTEGAIVAGVVPAALHFHRHGEGTGIHNLRGVAHHDGVRRQGRTQDLPDARVEAFEAGHFRGIARENLPDPALALRALCGRLAAGERRRQGEHGGTGVGLDRHRRRIHRCQFRGVDVDPDDVPRYFEFRQEVVACRDFRAHQQHDIGVGECLLARFLQDRAAQRQRVGIRQYSLARIAGENRRSDALRDVGQWLARADGAAPDEDQRALGPREAIRGLIDRGRIGHRQGRCAPRLPLRLDGRREDVPRQRQVYRARPAAAKHSIGTRNQFRQLVRISDHGAERGEPGRDRRLISELVDRSPAFPLRWGGRRPGQYQHGLRIAVSLRDAGRRVGDARPANDRADSWLAGRARVAVGHEAGALLVATLHVADPGTRDAAVQLESHRTGHAEHGIHLVGREQPHHGLTACHGAHMFPLHSDD